MAGTKPTVEMLTEQLRVDRADFQLAVDNFTERISELELQQEDIGWTRLSGGNQKAWSREALRKITDESFLFRMKNPIIRRAVLTQANYVFGQGVTVKADHPVVDEVVQAFMSDKKNKKIFTDIISMVKAESDLWVTANLFFVFFRNGEGDVRMSTIPFDEITDTVTAPQDRNETRYYLRTWTPKGKSTQKEYYPALDYTPDQQIPTYNGHKINWDTPVYHVSVNRVLDQKFGTSEIYASQDWARAYNKFLSDWSTIVRSYARFAWDMTRKAGSAGRLAAKAKLDSGISTDSYHPSPSTGSTIIHGEDTKMTPIRTAGATTSAEDGRRLLLMVCADTGLPETFFGDASVGSLATARSLNRPTELGFSLRQRMWEIVIETMCAYAIQCKAEVGYGVLSGDWTYDAWQEQIFVYDDDNENEDVEKRGEPIDVTVNVDFPPLVEDNQKEQIEAIVSAATLNGSTLAGTLDAKYATEKLLRVLGETSVEEVIDRLFPEGEEPEAVAVAGAVQDLQQAIEALSEVNEMERGDVVKLLAETFVHAFKEASKDGGDE